MSLGEVGRKLRYSDQNTDLLQIPETTPGQLAKPEPGLVSNEVVDSPQRACRLIRLRPCS